MATPTTVIITPAVKASKKVRRNRSAMSSSVDDAAEGERDLRGQGHDEAVDDADPDQHLDGEDADDERAEAEHRRRRTRAGERGRGHAPCSPLCSARSSTSRMPRLASSRRSLQISAT